MFIKQLIILKTNILKRMFIFNYSYMNENNNVVVIGNSIIQGLDIRTERLLGEIAVMQGLSLEGVYCIRDKRVGASITQSSVRQGARSTATLSEFAVVVRQP